jgi:uncharacterized circularly permuted ATP-grasp superfamily protein
VYKIFMAADETWSLILKEKHRLRVFENRVLRRTFGPKREVTEGWRRLHNEAPHDLYSSLGIFRMMKSRKAGWVDHVVRMRRRGIHMGYWWERQKERDHRKTKT